MSRRCALQGVAPPCFPRVSGDEPGAITISTRDPVFSPRERG